MAIAPDLRKNYSLLPVSELHMERPLQEEFAGEVKGILLPYSQIRERVDVIARQLTTDYEKNEVLFVWLRHGAKRFKDELADSGEQQDLRIRYAPLPLTASSYHGNTSTGNVTVDESELAVIRNRLREDGRISNVVLIEDIVDSGLTMTRVVRDVLALHEYPEINVSICTLLDKPDQRLAEYEGINELIQYVGFTIPDVFVIGFGLDYNKRFREMDHIGIPTEETIAKYRTSK